MQGYNLNIILQYGLRFDFWGFHIFEAPTIGGGGQMSDILGLIPDLVAANRNDEADADAGVVYLLFAP